MSKTSPIALALLPAALAAGCVSYQPAPLDPVAELAVLKARDLGEVVRVFEKDRTEAGVAKVFDTSDGLDADELVAVALTLNTELRAKRLEVGEARAGLIQAGLLPNPKIDFSVGRGFSAGAGTILELDLLLELLRKAERTARVDAAKARVDEVRAEIAAEEWRVAAEVRRQWLAVLAAERSVDLLEAEGALREKSREFVRRRREIGEGTELEVAAADLDAGELRREKLRAQAELEIARRELNRLLGVPPDYSLRLSDSGKPLPVALAGEPADDEVDRRLLAGRPDLKTKEAAFRRADRELLLAVEGQYPRLELGPALDRESGGDWFLGAGLGLELPFSDRNQGEIAEKDAQRERARAEYAAALQGARAQAFDALRRMRSARAELDAVERDLVPLVQRTQDLAERAFRAGEIPVLDWITAQQRALASRRGVLESAVRYRAAVIDFEAALGPPPKAAAEEISDTEQNGEAGGQDAPKASGR